MASTIGDRIRALREAQGISRVDFARDVGIAVTTLSDLELGRSRSTSSLHRIATRLGVSAVELETGHGPRERGAAPPTAADAARELLAMATPRSRRHLESIIAAAQTGKLTDADIELLGSIAARFAGK